MNECLKQLRHTAAALAAASFLAVAAAVPFAVAQSANPPSADAAHDHSHSANQPTPPATADQPQRGTMSAPMMQGMMQMMQGMMTMMQGQQPSGGAPTSPSGSGMMMNCPMMQGQASPQGMMQMMQNMMRMMQAQMQPDQKQPEQK